MLRKVREEAPVSPRQHNPQCPPDLETLCLKCLEKDPEKRLESAEALAEELNRFLGGRPILSRPVSRREQFWRWVQRNPGLSSLAAALMLVLLLGTVVSSLFAWQLSIVAEQEHKQREEAELQLYYSQIYRAAGDLEAGRHDQALAVLKRIPFDQRYWEANYLTRQAEGTSLTLRGHESFVDSVAFSPDGRRIASGRRR